MTETTR